MFISKTGKYVITTKFITTCFSETGDTHISFFVAITNTKTRNTKIKYMISLMAHGSINLNITKKYTVHSTANLVLDASLQKLHDKMLQDRLWIN